MKKLMSAAIGAIVLLSACSLTAPVNVDSSTQSINSENINSPTTKTTRSLPSWAIQAPVNDANGVYAIGVGESEQMQTAIEESVLNAKEALAKAFVYEMSIPVQNDTDGQGYQIADYYRQIVNGIVESIPMTGYQTLKQEIITENGKHISYQLMTLTYEQFEKTIEEQHSMRIASLDMTQAFNEIERRIELYKQQRVAAKQ